MAMGCVTMAEETPVKVPVLYPQVVAIDDDTLLIPARRGILEYKIAERKLTKVVALDGNMKIDLAPRTTERLPDRKNESYVDQYANQVKFKYYNPSSHELYFTCTKFPEVHQYQLYDIDEQEYVYDTATKNYKEFNDKDLWRKNKYMVGGKWEPTGTKEYFQSELPGKPEERFDISLTDDKYELDNPLKKEYKYLSVSISNKNYIFFFDTAFDTPNRVWKKDADLLKVFIVAKVEDKTVKVLQKIYEWKYTTENLKKSNIPIYSKEFFPGQINKDRLYFNTDVFLTAHIIKYASEHGGDVVLPDALYTLRVYDVAMDTLGIVAEKCYYYGLPYAFYVQGDTLYYFRFNGYGTMPSLVAKKLDTVK
jgi:hypothetical protein